MAKSARKAKATGKPNTASIGRKKESADTVIYVGPTIKGTILSTFTIFAEGIPKDYKAHPTLKHLFVPPERLDQARREIGRTGSLRNTYYKRAIEETKQKEGK